MKSANFKLQIGPAARWVVLDGRRVVVQSVLREWDEPAAPWAGVAERRYARLLLQSGAVLDVYREGDRWTVSAVED
ncbi:MAG TPA: hypothetical protein VGM51_11420 [Armatimonadota bacterium]